MEGYDLWSEASRDVEAEDRASRMAHATAQLADLWPWFASATSAEDLAHRKAMAYDSLSMIASRVALPTEDVEGIVDRHHALLMEAKDSHDDDCNCPVCKNDDSKGGKDSDDDSDDSDDHDDHDGDDDDDDSDDDDKDSSDNDNIPPQFKNSKRKYALPDGVDPLEWVRSIMPGQGQPEKPDSHTTEFDGSGGYSEVPAGPLPGGPNPNVVVPEDLRPQEDGWPVPQNKALHGGEATIPAQTQGRTQARRQRRTAQGTDPSQMAPGDPLAGMPGAGGMSSNPAGVSPDMNVDSGPMTTKPRQMPGGGGGGADPSMGGSMDDTGAVSDTNNPQPNGLGATSSTGDPVADQVNRVAARVRQDNPTLDEQSCRRVARKVVAAYLTKRADDVDYVGNQNKQQDDGKDDGDGGGGMTGAEVGAGMVGGRAVMKALPLLEL